MRSKFVMVLVLMLCFVGVSLSYAQDGDEAPVAGDSSVDTDKDGMPDAWEKKMGLNFRNRFDAQLDPDGDKVKNIDEYKIGTHPKDKDTDKDGDGVADDWMKYMGFTDADADADGDGVSNKEEYLAGTDPKDPKSSPKAAEVISQKHPDPSMKGISENIDKSIPDNHQIKPNVFKYNDPIGDDKGPGYYTYPTSPVYTAGSFDIVSFEIDASGKDNVVFKITINADLKQNWGMAADFDVQHFQIYIDMDGVPGSGEVQCIPGLNVFFDPANAWDRMVMITPQPRSRVQIEVDVKAKEYAENVVIPSKITGQGRTITAVVSKKSLGMAADADISKWAWQVIAQSNEGFPNADDVLTRDVNEFRGIHRIGKGSNFQGDPELIDILVWPGKGTMQEAEDQFKIMNIWESYPDPKLDIKVVLPFLKNDQTEQWMPKGGYKENAKALAEKIKPPPQKDKYVSDNFTMSPKMFSRWNWNLDPGRENVIHSSLEFQFFGKAFTDKVNFYMRWEMACWDDTVWSAWDNNFTPGQQPIVLQAYSGIIVNPLPTVDAVTIGNYEVDYSPWTMGAAWYPDRDKFKGIFIDGSIEGVLDYHLTMHYPFNWIGFDFTKGKSVANDFAYGLKLNSATLVKGLKVTLVTTIYTDYENSLISGTNNEPAKLLLRGYNFGQVVEASYKLKLPFMSVSLGGTFVYSDIRLGEDFKKLEIGFNTDIDGNGTADGTLKGGVNNPNGDFEDDAFAGVATLRLENIAGLFNIIAQGFYIDHHYVQIGAARGDTAAGTGFGGSPTADILEMSGNQSAHWAPQAADFYASVPIPPFPTEFRFSDPATSTKTIGWINNNWEGVAAMGWQGFTTIVKFTGDLLRADAEMSMISFNNPDYSNKTELRLRAGVELALIKINSKVVFEGLMSSINDAVIAEQVKKPLVISPKLTYEQQLSKFVMGSLSYRLDMGIYNEKGSLSTATNKTLNRHRIGLDLLFALPVGQIKIMSETWFEPKQPADKNGFVNGFTGRQPYGAYAITEWEFAF